MTEEELEAKDIERKVLDLAKSIDRIKNRQADRDDVVVEIREARMSRLELLADDLAPVIADIPNEIDIFEFGLSKGEVSRLWIDLTTFVRLAKDGRTYELVKDTRMGRTLLMQTKDREQIGEALTDYIADRILERERVIEGDWVSLRQTGIEHKSEDGDLKNNELIEAARNKKLMTSILRLIIWLLIGFSVGLATLLLVFYFDQPDLRNRYFSWIHNFPTK